MGLFGDISAFGLEQKKKRHEDFKKLLPVFSTWNNIEKNLSPDEKKREKNFFAHTFFMGIVFFAITSVTPYLQREDYDFWPVVETSFFKADVLMASEGFFGKSSVPTVGDIDRSEMSEVLNYEVSAGDTLHIIASRYGIRVLTLLENNSIPNQNKLKTGMKLILEQRHYKKLSRQSN